MPTANQFPWELLKAECLRLVCAELVHAGADHGVRHSLARRDEMVHFLEDVNERGLDSALKAVDFTSPRKTENAAATRTSSKRKSSRLEENEEEDVEGYNTRFKGVKRVRVGPPTPTPEPSKPAKPRSPRTPKKSEQTDPDSTEPASAQKRGRGRPRKSVVDQGIQAATLTPKKTAPKKATGAGDQPKRGRGRPRKSAPSETVRKPAALAEDQPKRGRGRPRKSAPSEIAGKTAAPDSKSGKQVLVGVVLKKRAATQVETDPDAEAEGDEETMEEDTVVAVINGAANGDVSSLGGSNKENVPNGNEPIQGPSGVAAGDHDGEGEMDADGVPDAEAP